MKPRATATNAPSKPRRKKAPHSIAVRPAAIPVLERMSPELRRAVLALRGLKGVF